MGEDGRRTLGVWAHDLDTLRQRILARRGYTRDGTAEHQHRLDLSAPIWNHPVAEGSRCARWRRR